MVRLFQVEFPPPHYFFYDLESLKLVLRSAGFEVREHFFISEIFLSQLGQRTWALAGFKKVAAIVALTILRVFSFGRLSDSLVIRAQLKN